MPNNKKQVMNIVNAHIPSTATSNSKKFEYSYNDIIIVSPSKVQENSKRLRLSPHSSCGSSTSSAFSSYCTTSCNSSTCSRNHTNQTSSVCTRSELSTSDSSTISCSGSCQSDCQHSHKSLSTNTYSNSNVSSCSSSQSSSISPNSLTDETDDNKQVAKTERRFTRSSASASDINNSNNSTSRNSSYSTTTSSDISSENSNSTSTVVTTKITRSTVLNMLTKESLKSSTSLNGITSTNDSAAKKECLWYKCKYVGHATDVDDSLINHIKSEHIYSQKDLKRFRCMWKGCSVYSKPAFHFNWLERHVVDHIEKNPFMCIFDGCKRKFRTEEAREKHCQCHINNSDNNNHVQPVLSSSASPVKARNHLLLNSAKLALIQNIKNKTTTVQGKFKSAKPSTNYSQILKTLTKKRKAQAMTFKKFKKAQFKDFFDDFSIQMIGSKLTTLNYHSGKFTFSAEIIGKRTDMDTKAETFLIQWNPKNIIENEWIEKDNLCRNLTKELTLSELNVKANSMNPFYRTHRFRTNRRK